MSEITIRPARRDDPVRAHIASIYTDFGLVFDPDFEDDLNDVIQSYTPGLFLVANDETGLLATAAVVPNGDARLIKRMYVAPRARRRGLAWTLLERVSAWGSFARSELWSDLRFPGAHAMYLRAGFIAGGTRVLDDPDRSVERYFSRIEPR